MINSSYQVLIFDWEGTLVNAGIPVEGALLVLSSLQHAGYILAIATGKSRRGLDQDLKRLSMEPYFSYWRGGDEGFGKPHPQMLQTILEKLEVKPTQALMIGDTSSDLNMANAAGVKSLGVSWGMESRETLMTCHPLGCIDDIIELPTWLKNH
jgi:phosphoglycolate phosphatase